MNIFIRDQLTAEKLNSIRFAGWTFKDMSLRMALVLIADEAHRVDCSADPSCGRGVPIMRLIDDGTANEVLVSVKLEECSLCDALLAVANSAGLAVYVNSSGAAILPHSIGRLLDTICEDSQAERIRQLGTPPAATIPGIPRTGYNPVAACRAVLARVRQGLRL